MGIAKLSRSTSARPHQLVSLGGERRRGEVDNAAKGFEGKRGGRYRGCGEGFVGERCEEVDSAAKGFEGERGWER